jgi:hypothetical protein
MDIARASSGSVVLFIVAALVAGIGFTVARDTGYANPPSLRKSATSPADRFAERATRRANRVRESLDSFELRISPEGENEKPFYSLLLSVAPPATRREDQTLFDRSVRITREQASRVVDYFSRDEFFLRSAYEVSAQQDFPPLAPYVQNYVVTLTTARIRLWEDWGWGPTMVKRMRRLRSVLSGDAARNMDLLLDRIQ